MDSEYWSRSHPVLEVLRSRRERPDPPGQRRDGYKVGLAVEGGGIRGVVSAAMLAALEDCGLPFTAFDAIYGTSSGAINSAYYIGGNTWYPLSIYFDDLSTPEFVNFRRLLTGNILNLDYALDKVISEVKPLDVPGLLVSPVPLHISITNVDELRTVTVAKFESVAEVMAALRASMWLPVAIRGTTHFRDFRAVDGGVLTAHPFQLALDDGCTHVLSLSTRPIQPPRMRFGPMHYFTYWHLERLQRGLGSGYLAAVRRYRTDRRRLQARMREPGEAPYVLDLAPLPWMAEVKRHETRLGPILTGARGGYELMCCAIEGIDPGMAQSGGVQAIPRFTFVRRDYGSRSFGIPRPGTPPRMPTAVQPSGSVGGAVEVDD
ncbi:patatin-like phospholipase family protein [Micromonospora sp. NPDC049559]|uniref:patatin-like phospholipase family protein n=1 Tax=Micromonospora sp. NPDC049559 TaxID=3155923 RepID=UPI003424928B